MERRRFLRYSAALTVGVSGCIGSDRSGEETPERVDGEVSVVMAGWKEYDGSLQVSREATGEVVLEESLAYRMDMETPDEAGVSSGMAYGGGYFPVELVVGETYDVVVSIDTGVERTYRWTVESEYGLRVESFSDQITFEEAESVFVD